MDNILYISGDGIRDQIESKIYTKHFISDAKNYFITKELKSLVDNCEIINFSWWFGHPRFIVKLESSGLRGTTRIKIITTKIINLISRIIIYWKIKINSVDLIVLCDNLFFIDEAILNKIKRLNTSKIVLLSNVSPKYLLTQFERECIPYYDTIFISDLGHEMEWKDLGAQRVIRLPISAGAPNTYQKIIGKVGDNKIYDVVFIGSLYGLDSYKLEILDFLISKGVDINIWTGHDNGKRNKTIVSSVSNGDGSPIDDFPRVKSRVKGLAHGEKMVKIFAQSKIALNIHILTQPCGGNLRLFEIPSAKTFQIVDKCPSDWFIDGHEIVLFKNKNDLLSKINYYLNNDHERIRICNNGFKRLVKEHTYEHRVKELLNTMHR